MSDGEEDFDTWLYEASLEARAAVAASLDVGDAQGDVKRRMTEPDTGKDMVVLMSEDDPFAESIVQDLTARGYAVLRAGHGERMSTRLPEAMVILLDLDMPDGLDRLRLLRKESDVPVLVFSARMDERLSVRALRLGADSHLYKQSSPAHLAVALESVLRRAGAAKYLDGPIRIGDLEIDVAARRVLVGGQEVELTATEFALLSALAKHPGAAVRRQSLLAEAWGDAYLGSHTSLDVYVAQLKAKLGRPDLITQVEGDGYRLES